MVNFLPFNTIRYFFKRISDGKKQKQATDEAVKEAGLNTISYDAWTDDQFLLYNGIRNKKLISMGLPESKAKIITIDGMPALKMDTGFYITQNERSIQLFRAIIIEDQEELRRIREMMVDSKVTHYEQRVPPHEGRIAKIIKDFCRSEPLHPTATDIQFKGVNGKSRIFEDN